MGKVQDEETARSNKMMRALVAVFIAIVLQDACTGRTGWSWNLAMCIIIVILFVGKIILFSNRNVLIRVGKHSIRKTR